MVRAMAHLADLPGVTLTSAGDGEDLAACRAEAERLGLAGRVGFLGQVPRAEVDRLYARADVFAFPSFREPMGGVVFEALHWGLPVITAARGGPDFIVDDSCGIRVPVTDPVRYPRDIAAGGAPPRRRSRAAREARRGRPRAHRRLRHLGGDRVAADRALPADDRGAFRARVRARASRSNRATGVPEIGSSGRR